MKTYREIEAGLIEWRDDNTIGAPFTEQTILKRTNDEGDVETYSPWSELIESGVEVEWLTDEQKADQLSKAEKDKINAEALAYLASTDWYDIRSISGKAFPEDIATKRQEAREAIQ